MAPRVITAVNLLSATLTAGDVVTVLEVTLQQGDAMWLQMPPTIPVAAVAVDMAGQVAPLAAFTIEGMMELVGPADYPRPMRCAVAVRHAAAAGGEILYLLNGR